MPNIRFDYFVFGRVSWFSMFTALLWRSFHSIMKEPRVSQIKVAQVIVSIADIFIVCPGVQFYLHRYWAF